LALPSTITTNSWPDFKSANLGPFPRFSLLKQDTSNDLAEFGSNSFQKLEESFKAPGTGPLVYSDLHLKELGGGNPDGVQVELYSHDAGGNQSGSLLATSQLLSGIIVSSNQNYKRFVFPSPAQVTLGETYWLRVSRTGSLNDTERYAWGVHSSNPYADGRLRTYNGTSWADWAVTTADARFKIAVQQPGRYGFALDKTNNKVRCYKSTDNETWTEQDSANAPAVSSTATLKSIYCVSFDTTIKVFVITSSTRLDIFNYNTENDTWGSSAFNTTTPTFNTNVSNVAPMVGAYRSADYPAAATVLSDHLFANNKAAETVMGNARRRIGLSRRLISNNTWNTPYDVIGSAANPPDATLPATAIDYDLRAGGVDRGAVFNVFWTQSDDSVIRLRGFTYNNIFTAITVVGSPGAAVSNTAAWVMSPPVNFFRSSAWHVAFVYVDSGVLKCARCPLVSLYTASSWTLASIVTASIETTASNPAVLIPDNENGGRLFCRYTTTDGKLWETHDQGANTWITPYEVRPGTKTVGGISMNVLPDAIGTIFSDTNPATDEIRYDQTEVFFMKIDYSTGSYESIRDLGTAGQADCTVNVDVDEIASTSYRADFYTRETETDAWQLMGGLGSDAVDTNALFRFVRSRYVKTIVTITGDEISSGVSAH
jgi:hypothetical protein